MGYGYAGASFGGRSTAFTKPISIWRFRKLPVFFTVVLPGGCMLNCPFCIIKFRDERSIEANFTSELLAAIVAALAKRRTLAGCAVVGDEPLQKTAWPFAQIVLEKTAANRLPSSLVTNGYALKDYVDELDALESTQVLVSLDAIGKRHDEIRGKVGTFENISFGIRRASNRSTLIKRISIGTVVMPGNLNDLEDILVFASSHGITQLRLSPLLDTSRKGQLRIHPKVMNRAWAVFPRLMRRAALENIRLQFSDEFALLGEWKKRLEGIGIEVDVASSKANLIRVDAGGHVEITNSIRNGLTTGLRLPHEINMIDDFIDKLLGAIHGAQV